MIPKINEILAEGKYAEGAEYLRSEIGGKDALRKYEPSDVQWGIQKLIYCYLKAEDYQSAKEALRTYYNTTRKDLTEILSMYVKRTGDIELIEELVGSPETQQLLGADFCTCMQKQYKEKGFPKKAEVLYDYVQDKCKQLIYIYTQYMIISLENHGDSDEAEQMTRLRKEIKSVCKSREQKYVYQKLLGNSEFPSGEDMGTRCE